MEGKGRRTEPTPGGTESGEKGPAVQAEGIAGGKAGKLRALCRREKGGGRRESCRKKGRGRREGCQKKGGGRRKCRWKKSRARREFSRRVSGQYKQDLRTGKGNRSAAVGYRKGYGPCEDGAF